MQVDPEHLFLRTIADLRSKCGGDWYDLIRAAGLIRQLILDNLYDIVNQKYKIKLEFNIAVSDVKPTSKGYSFHNLENGKERKIVDRDEFLKRPIVIYDFDKTYSVREIIAYAANVNGGVHASPNFKEEHEKINKLYELFKPMDYPFEFIALTQICSVVVKAMGPLEKLVQEKAVKPYPPPPPKELMGRG